MENGGDGRERERREEGQGKRKGGEGTGRQGRNLDPRCRHCKLGEITGLQSWIALQDHAEVWLSMTEIACTSMKINMITDSRSIVTLVSSLPFPNHFFLRIPAIGQCSRHASRNRLAMLCITVLRCRFSMLGTHAVILMRHAIWARCYLLLIIYLSVDVILFFICASRCSTYAISAISVTSVCLSLCYGLIREIKAVID